MHILPLKVSLQIMCVLYTPASLLGLQYLNDLWAIGTESNPVSIHMTAIIASGEACIP